ncbi:MAG: hypothetical protein M3Q39_13795 [Actinomycetota bacterium]|nr:hypothetical protein [Actinomycetota bacterium]
MRKLPTDIFTKPFEFAIALALFIVCVIFTAFPEALAHAPVGFEDRGIAHHMFHYTLLLGSLLILVGLLVKQGLADEIERAGLVLTAGALTVNLIGFLAGDPLEELPGVGLAIRAAVILGLVLRAVAITRFPRIIVVAPDRGDS